jgi:hypothetical protein
MIGSRRFITAVALVMVFTPFVYSDILPMLQLNGGCSYHTDAFSYKTVLQNIRSSSQFICPVITDIEVT